MFGQQLGSTRVSARRRTDDWQFELDSDAIAGTLLVPVDLARRAAGRRRHAAALLERRRRRRRRRHERPRSARAAGLAAARRRVRHRPAADRAPRRRDPGRSAGASARLVRERDRQLHARKAAAAGSSATKATRRASPSASTRRTSARCSTQLGVRAVRRSRDRRGHGERLLAGAAVGRLARSHRRRSRAARAEGQPRRRASPAAPAAPRDS